MGKIWDGGKGREMVGGWWVEWREEIIGNVCYVMRSLFG